MSQAKGGSAGLTPQEGTECPGLTSAAALPPHLLPKDDASETSWRLSLGAF